MQYHRNDLAFERGNFRVMGDTIDLYPANGEYAYRFEFGFDALEEVPRKSHTAWNAHKSFPCGLI